MAKTRDSLALIPSIRFLAVCISASPPALVSRRLDDDTWWLRHHWRDNELNRVFLMTHTHEDKIMSQESCPVANECSQTEESARKIPPGLCLKVVFGSRCVRAYVGCIFSRGPPSTRRGGGGGRGKCVFCLMLGETPGSSPALPDFILGRSSVSATPLPPPYCLRPHFPSSGLHSLSLFFFLGDLFCIIASFSLFCLLPPDLGPGLWAEGCRAAL